MVGLTGSVSSGWPPAAAQATWSCIRHAVGAVRARGEAPLALPPARSCSLARSAHAPSIACVFIRAGPSAGRGGHVHRRQSQVRDHRFSRRGGRRGVAECPRDSRARRGGRHRRSSPAAQPLAGGPGRRSHAERARLTSPPTGCARQAGRVSTSDAAPELGQSARIHVHAAQIQSVSGPLVQLAVQAGQNLLPCRADRAPHAGQPGRDHSTQGRNLRWPGNRPPTNRSPSQGRPDVRQGDRRPAACRSLRPAYGPRLVRRFSSHESRTSRSQCRVSSVPRIVSQLRSNGAAADA